MFVIKCPYCGERDQTEFSCHGEAHIERPENPETLSDEEWGEYLFIRSNKKGIHYEIMLVPNITNITYGRGVGYVFEEEVFDEEISTISATKIRAELRDKGEL